jgi:hypothetical protein
MAQSFLLARRGLANLLHGMDGVANIVFAQEWAETETHRAIAIGRRGAEGAMRQRRAVQAGARQ